MDEIIAQILGLAVTLICILSVQFKNKWQMLICSLIANFLNIVMYFILDGITSAMAVSIVATLQCGVNLYLTLKNKTASVPQKIVFTLLFLSSGVLQYKELLDLLPTLGALLFMVSVFQKTEQKMRFFGALNCIAWLVYNTIIGSTAVFAQLFTLGSTLIAMYRYKSKK